MMVDVVVLRRGGQKRSPAELSVVPPHRMTLTVRREVYKAPPLDEVVAILSHGEYRPPYLNAVELRGATLTKVLGDSFILVGREAEGTRPNQTFVPQAWWCRVVTDPTVPPSSNGVPADGPRHDHASEVEAL